MKRVPLCLRTDSYKFSHYKQAKPKTTRSFSYIESRGGLNSETLFCMLQYYLKEYLEGEVVTMEDVEYGLKRTTLHGVPFNYDGWKYIVEEHGGKLPVIIKAVPEGTVVPVKNVMVTIENTDPKCYWLPSLLETMLLKVWYPITVATTSMTIKRIIGQFMDETAGHREGIEFKLHDFGYRGVSSEESAAIGGAANLINFLGSDTFIANEFLKEYYNEEMASFSIDATEHSTTTSWTREGEFDFYENLTKVYKDKGIFACVIDSYNTEEAINMWGKLKGALEANEQMVVLRPDSGDPVKMSLFCVDKIDKQFGHTYNKKGFKVLNNARVIYGDGISSPDVIRKILSNLRAFGYSAENIAFGMGGGLLQKCDRDTQKFAMKCSAVVTDGKMVPVYKDPITDHGKKSKRGFLDLQRDVKGKFITIENMPSSGTVGSELVEVFKDGEVLKEYTLEQVRRTAAEYL